MNDERFAIKISQFPNFPSFKPLNLSFSHFLILSLSLLLSGCFQPKEGCLDIRAANYDVSADDPCTDNCCKYPTLSITLQHRVILPGQPDTSFTMRYDSLYPAPFDTTHYFSFERSRFFLSNFRLVRENGGEVGVSDSIKLKTVSGVDFTVKNSFAKADRDIFQASSGGVFLASGVFTKIKFTLGLPDPLPQTDPESVPTGHPLSIANDTLIYEEGAGYIPSRLIFRPDTLPGTDSLDFRFLTPREVELPLAEPFVVEQGFNLKLTLFINYLAWFEGIDLKNDSPATMQAKIDSNLTKAISVTEIKME
jgi:hypothetical protein